jgi:hypothetical protein
MKTLLEQAEEARQAGDRPRFQELTRQAEKERYDALQARHAAEVERVKKEFPIGEIVPVINNRVTDIKDGCGTQRGWINIYFGGEKGYTPQEVRAKIAKSKEEKRVTAKYAALKFSDRAKKGVCIGEYNEALDDLKTAMCLDRVYSLQEADEQFFDYDSGAYSYAYDQAIADGFKDEEAEEKAQEAADEERDEEYRKYKNRFVSCLEYVLRYADLELIEDKHKWYIRPATSWKHSAAKMAEVITGYGTFEFNSALELKEGLPAKTYAEAVIVHIHWLKHGPEVYGDRSYSSIMDY